MSEPTKVFISYARADGLDVAAAVQTELESSGFKVWRDLRDLDAFTDFSVEIERAISACDAMVVCITPSIAQASESFVRREILYAQAKEKPIVPLRIATAEVPLLIIHLTWVEVSKGASVRGMLSPEIQRRLHMRSAGGQAVARPRPTVVFVRGLLDDIVTTLEGTTKVLLDIAATGWSASKPMRGGLPSSMQKLVRSQSSSTVTPGFIGQELSENHKRVVLHGEAGSGKTTSLLIAGREAANAWLEDQEKRLPVFCRAADWNASKDEPLIKWLDRSTPLLPTSDLKEALQSGNITLFIDGLDELGAYVTREVDGKKVLVDPRADLIGKIPPQVAVLVTSRSEALDAIGGPPGFELVEMEAITEDQIASFVSNVPRLTELLFHDEALREMVKTPLTLGLLAFVVSHQGITSERKPENEKLSPRLRLIYEFTVSRWEHENLKTGDLIPAETLVSVLGRLATWGRNFTTEDIEEAAKPDGAHGASVCRISGQLGLIRRSNESSYDFFHPLFADCYATIHCWKYLGKQVPDGWDSRLFSRIAQLNDSSFVPTLTKMTSGFWRGEFEDEVAMALAALGDPDDPDVVPALLRLAGSNVGLGRGNWIHEFVESGGDAVRSQFVKTLKETAVSNIEAIHQIVGLGESGIAALVEVYNSLESTDPMRKQIASYNAVRERLSLD
ncbi:MAG: hypothetical protein C1942_00840 [Prosthecochloris sp.]|uniref:TIR domain-containing protein n=1 Tax=Prosthecochloris sp. TaxID=290513 RepID=UPI0013CB2BE7|nr:TIR domain-containing protein [Prosthecochloris sp.]NEX11243.1 hypothetical protein [Prosthecochloris sp.]